MSDAGYVRLYRSLIGHAAFRNDAEAMAFAWMIARAAWKPSRVRYKGHALTLNRGQVAISVRDFADAMDRDKGWVERLLRRLKTETMIETHTETGVMVVTICKYDEYQAEAEPRETPRETLRETHARQTQDTEQRREELKKAIPERDAVPIGEFDQRCRALAQIINLTRPIAASDRAQLQAWIREGFHFEYHVIEGAKAVVAREEAKGGSVRSFKYLDGGIRDYRAEWLAERNRLNGAAA